MPKYNLDNGVEHWGLSQREGKEGEPPSKSTWNDSCQGWRWYRTIERYGVIHECAQRAWWIFTGQSLRGESS